MLREPKECTMEEQNGTTSFHKPKKTGFKGKPPYSVETPYGFQIDLDFLKYVDDIEKGNTIKRVPVQRRSKGPRASTLPRHLNTSGNGYRSTLWGSTGALGPRSRPTDVHHPPSHSSSVCDRRLQLSPTGLKSLSEMEARIKEFDEQPLGEHIRPHLLRASSLPLTVLLRQTSESTDDAAASLRSSRDHLDGRNTSCESIFDSAGSPQPRECSRMPRCLSEALEHVKELELEVRVIPELRAQIRFLQEERERLCQGLSPQVYSPKMNGTADHGTFSCYSITDVKRPRHESHITFPKSHDDVRSSQEWRASTDLDELLTVTSLQAKVAVLEQKLHETGLELQRALGLLKEQQEEGKRKDERIENLVRNPAVWVRAERVMVDQDGDETAVRTSEQGCNDKVVSSKGLDTIFESKTPPASDRSGQTSDADTAVVVRHIKKIKRLLEQQWECLRANSKSGKESQLLTQQDSKVGYLQREMMALVDVLESYYTQNRRNDKEMIAPKALKSILKTDMLMETSKSQHSVDVNEGHVASGVGEESVSDSSAQTYAAQVDTEKNRREPESQMSPDAQMTPGKSGSAQTDGSEASAEADVSQKMAKTKTKPAGEQTERFTSSETTTGGEGVSADFMAACHFLNDHMENMDNPNDDMRKALVVLFQHWFSAAAEEASVPSKVSVYLREVKKATPSLLAFLINLADDNGNTVLHYSVSHCNYGIVGQLLDTGVSDLNLQNNAGYTAVMLASLTAPDGPGGMEVVRKIMELGNINVRSSQTGQTALHLAVRHGRVVMVRLLLSCGADTNIQDSQGNTVLMFAAERGHTHIARLLLERSQCDLTLTDKRGQTAISIAMRGSHTDTAALLQAHAKARTL